MRRKKEAESPRPTQPDPPAQSADAGPEAPPLEPAAGRRPFAIVGIGASAGGLEAFTQLLGALPLDTGMGFVLVQHLDPQHESALTQILARATKLPVSEITTNQPVEANHVHVIPPDTTLTIQGGVLQLEPRPRTRTPHRPIDSFFESLAEDQQDRAVGVVLSGTASDGTLGLEAIKAEGGITFAQDDSAKHSSMPRSAVAAGCVDLVMAPIAIAEELGRIAAHPYVAGQAREFPTRPEADRDEGTKHADDATPLPSGGHGSPSIGAGAGVPAANGYKQILISLRNHSGVDFSLYKSATIQRRVNRRVILSRLETLEEYAGFLKGNPQELGALYSDVLISVTSFFRNPEMFEALKSEVLPRLLTQETDAPVRVWVLGCSTGQEAYSIAMTFVEAAGLASQPRRLQVFATDLNDALLEKARHGLYARTLAQEISPERLRRFFVEEDGGYRVSKLLREMVVFARQNLITDPPFSRLDLISCRNLLIYLEPSLQKKAMPTFHYALKPGGYLLLGASESISGFTDLFEPVDKRYKIYARKDAPSRAPLTGVPQDPGTRWQREALPPLPLRRAENVDPSAEPRGELNAQREADRIMVSQFAPPGVLVNSELQVLQFRGMTGAYLEPPAGKASFDLLKMAREGLMLPLRAALEEARKDLRVVRRDKVRMRQDGRDRSVNLEVIPLKNLREPCFLVLFGEAGRDSGAGERGRLRVADDSAPAPAPAPPESRDDSARVIELESDLKETRAYLQTIQEEHEASHEELQAASEEVQSANEELQSVNEELETSKEELESANEELITVNDEMNHRNLELNRLNNDLVNLQTSSRLAIVLLGRDLTIRRFSPQAEKLFELLAGDIGRPINQLRLHLTRVADAASGEDVPIDPGAMATEVIASIREQEWEVRDRAGRWHSLRMRPYLTLDDRVDGAVLVLVDIDGLKRGERAVAAARDLAENTLATVREPLLVLDGALCVETANASFYRTFGASAATTLGKNVFDLGDREWDIPRLRELLETILPLNNSVEDFEVDRDFGSLGSRNMLLNARRILDPGQGTERILLAIEDITVRRQVEHALRMHQIDLEAQVDELNRFNEMAVGRELRMIELKREINALCRQLGGAPRFKLDSEPAAADPGNPPTAPRHPVDEAGNPS